MPRDEDRDYSAESSRAVHREERRLDRIKAKAEAGEDQFKKLLRKMAKDPAQKQLLAKDCLEGYQGRKVDPRMVDISKDTTKARNMFPDELVVSGDAESTGVTDKSITGYEDRYWEEDD